MTLSTAAVTECLNRCRISVW